MIDVKILLLIAVFVSVSYMLWASIIVLYHRAELLFLMKAFIFTGLLTTLLKFIAISSNSTFFVRLFLCCGVLTVALFVAQMNRLTLRSPLLNYVVSAELVVALWEVLSVDDEALRAELTVIPIRATVIFIYSVIGVYLALVLFQRLHRRIKLLGIITPEEYYVYLVFVILSISLLALNSIFMASIYVNSLMFVALVANYMFFVIASILVVVLAYFSRKVGFYLVVSGLSGLTIYVDNILAARIGYLGDIANILIEADCRRMKLYFSDGKILAAHREKISLDDEEVSVTVIVFADRYEIETERFVRIFFDIISDRIRRDYLLHKKVLRLKQSDRLSNYFLRVLCEELIYSLRYLGFSKTLHKLSTCLE